MLYRISDHKYGHVLANSPIYKDRAIGVLRETESGIYTYKPLLRAMKVGVNHNCKAVEVGSMVILKATKDIKPGEELIMEAIWT